MSDTKRLSDEVLRGLLERVAPRKLFIERRASDSYGNFASEADVFVGTGASREQICTIYGAADVSAEDYAHLFTASRTLAEEVRELREKVAGRRDERIE